MMIMMRGRKVGDGVANLWGVREVMWIAWLTWGMCELCLLKDDFVGL